MATMNDDVDADDNANDYEHDDDTATGGAADD